MGGSVSSPVSCLSWSVPALATAGYWVGSGLGTKELEGGFQDGAQCACDGKLPNMAAASIYVPRRASATPTLPTSPPLPETLQDQKVGLAQAPIKLVLLPWVLVCVRFCVHPLRVNSISPIPVRLLNLSPAGLQNQMSRGLCSWCRTPGLGSLTWGSELSLLWENLCNIIILQFVGCPPRGYGTWLYHESTHLAVVPSLYL